jgi:hypothetical protein
MNEECYRYSECGLYAPFKNGEEATMQQEYRALVACLSVTAELLTAGRRCTATLLAALQKLPPQKTCI